MSEADKLLKRISEYSQGEFHKRETILSFAAFLEKVENNPRQMIRNANEYIRDTYEHFGSYNSGSEKAPIQRYKIFDLGTERNVPIIGSEDVQGEMLRVVNTFVKQGYSNKLLVLHGPNGSAKTSMIESVTHAMRKYSETDGGAVYKFNWIFPTDKNAGPKSYGESGPIGFGTRSKSETEMFQSYAHVDESKVSSRIHSEFKENPLFLIPPKEREEWLREVIAKKEGISPEDVEIPPHILLAGLSKRNQQILEQLLSAYNGDYSMVLRHVQVERFFYSKQYRVGISTVEPQMSIDASEKQLTMDRNISNIPSVLHNISFHETVGPIVEANRGVLEFSDLLKRPLEAFKYLLTTVEKSTINLVTSTAHLDIVFFATTNEKHLDAFKTMPDFASFRSRFELITAPYLLRSESESRIYEADVRILKATKPIAPHTVFLLSLWAILTRLKQPDPEQYDSKFRSLVSRLDPFSKAKLYEGKSLQPFFKPQEESVLQDLLPSILAENKGVVVYEGRFGASPREIKALLYKAVQNPKYKTLTPMCIFEELEALVKDRSVYEFLQLEARGKYHQPAEFIKVIQKLFAETFEHEVAMAMTLVEEDQYESLLTRYIENVVAAVKGEKIYDRTTGSHQGPNQSLMKELEDILKISGAVDRHREGLLGKIAAYKIDNPTKEIDIATVFGDYMKAIQDHYHGQRQKVVESTYEAMLSLGTDENPNITEEAKELAVVTYKNLESKYGYDRQSAEDSLRFLVTFKKKTS